MLIGKYIRTQEIRNKISLHRKGYPAWNKGKRVSLAFREKMRLVGLKRKAENGGIINSPETRIKISKALMGHKGVIHTKEFRIKMSKLKKGKLPPFFAQGKHYHNGGKDHYNWKGGKSFEPYPISWTNSLKETIRNHYERKCLICGKTEKENKFKLDVHHIDFNKDNVDFYNLVPLCHICHTKTMHNRTYWRVFLWKKIRNIPQKLAKSSI